MSDWCVCLGLFDFRGAVDNGFNASVMRLCRSVSNLERVSIHVGSVGFAFCAASHRVAANALNFCLESSVSSCALSFSSFRQAEESRPSYAGGGGFGCLWRLGGGGQNIFSLSK